MKNKFHTVIGVYRDNNQVWMEHVNGANSSADAAILALEKMSAEESSAVVVEVLEGKHMGTLKNDTMVGLNGGVLNELGG